MKQNPNISSGLKLWLGRSLSAAALLATTAAFSTSNHVRAGEIKTGDLEKAAKQQRNIYTMLSTWAQDAHQQFPNLPGDANANFRELFKKKLFDETSESWFAVPNDGLLASGKPDGDIGNRPDFAKALEPGEYSIAYVAGLNTSSDSDLPMLIGGAGLATGWITGVDKTPPAVPFKGSVVITYLGGQTFIATPGPDGKIMKMKHGKLLDIFSAEYGTKPENIRLPAVAKK